jgi:hypothetical protein
MSFSFAAHGDGVHFMRRVALIILSLAVLAVFPLGGTGRGCTMPMKNASAAECAACCSAMKSCAQPMGDYAAKADLASPKSSPLVSLALPLRGAAAIDAFSSFASGEAIPAQPAAFRPPRLALLCTRLI